MSDPDKIRVTTCSEGHINYLGPVDGRWRRAYTSARDRAKAVRHHNAVVKMMSEAIESGRKKILKSGRKPAL